VKLAQKTWFTAGPETTIFFLGSNLPNNACCGRSSPMRASVSTSEVRAKRAVPAAHSGHRDHPFRRIAIARFAASRSRVSRHRDRSEATSLLGSCLGRAGASHRSEATFLLLFWLLFLDKWRFVWIGSFLLLVSIG